MILPGELCEFRSERGALLLLGLSEEHAAARVLRDVATFDSAGVTDRE